MLTFVCLLATLLTGSPSQAADQPQVSKRVPLPVGWKEKPKPIGSVPEQPSCTQEKISGRADGDQRFLCLERKSAKSAKKFSIQSLPKVMVYGIQPQDTVGPA
ncbi:hypothetical protein [Streptomyces qinglanensis]|uniref:hypothetical protein n=1 Tax=Streptomyces qinglanensis TaxID=943816 RepID=UPI003D737346